MKITQITADKTLFALEGLIDSSLLDELHKVNWWKVPTKPLMSAQLRKIVILEAVPVLQKIDKQLREQSKVLAEKINLEFDFFYNDFWLDFPGWDVPMHTDIRMNSSLQLYLLGPENTGTTFYTDKSGDKVLYQAKFQPNNGYLLLKPPHAEDNLIWHDMKNTLPEDAIRLTSYVRLGAYHARSCSSHTH